MSSLARQIQWKNTSLENKLTFVVLSPGYIVRHIAQLR